MDTDGKGQVTARDLREVLGDTFEGTPVEQIFEGADAQGAGSFSFEFFYNYLHEEKTAPQGEPIDI